MMRKFNQTTSSNSKWNVNIWCCFPYSNYTTASSVSMRRRPLQLGDDRTATPSSTAITSNHGTQYYTFTFTKVTVLFPIILLVIVILSLEQDEYMSRALHSLFFPTTTIATGKSPILISTTSIVDDSTTTESDTNNDVMQVIESDTTKTATVAALETPDITIVEHEIQLVDISDNTTPNDSTTDTRTVSRASVFEFPTKPIKNIYSIFRESVGTNILKDAKKNPFRTCSPTVQFQLLLQQPSSSSTTRTTNGDNDVWLLQSYMTIYPYNNATAKIVPKTYGGDEIYVEWGYSNEVPVPSALNSDAVDTDLIESDVLGVAQVTDNNDGTYTLKFIRPPILQYNVSNHLSILPTIDVGRLTIYYDYTCYIGAMFAPDKDVFKRAGEVHLNMTQINIPRPYIHDFIPPNNNYLDVDLSQYDIIIAFGDSLILQFIRQYTHGGYWSSKIIYEENINQCISTMDEALTAIAKFGTWHDKHVQAAIRKNQTIALITGTAVWDAMRGCVRETDHLIDHQKAIKHFLLSIHEKYPMLQIHWKSPSAILLHRRSSLKEMEQDKVWLQRSRYISDTVPRTIYTVQKELLKDTELCKFIYFLDLFDAYYLSGPYTRIGDARHYQDAISSLLFSYFYKGIDFHKVYYNKPSPKVLEEQKKNRNNAVRVTVTNGSN